MSIFKFKKGDLVDFNGEELFIKTIIVDSDIYIVSPDDNRTNSNYPVKKEVLEAGAKILIEHGPFHHKEPPKFVFHNTGGKSARRKSPRRKSTRRKSTRRKSTRRKSTRHR